LAGVDTGWRTDKFFHAFHSSRFFLIERARSIRPFNPTDNFFHAVHRSRFFLLQRARSIRLPSPTGTEFTTVVGTLLSSLRFGPAGGFLLLLEGFFVAGATARSVGRRTRLIGGGGDQVLDERSFEGNFGSDAQLAESLSVVVFASLC
jgi:hypothetical protein